ncbi:MAG TPA: hypothetical protein VFB34_04975, partial [Chloroflexota bacterium]|nr:hypothetical protein [Chloroflexota bacterium]
GAQIWYDTSGRALYTQDPAAEAAGLNAITSYSYDCDPNAGTCSTDGTQTTTTVDANQNETQQVYVLGMMTAETRGVGTSQQATWNYTYDQNTLGTHSTVEPSNGSSNATPTTFTDWYGPGSEYGNVQCSIDQRGDETAYTYNTYNEILTKATPDELAQAQSGVCDSGAPTYETYYYYGGGNSQCPQTGLQAWLLACEIQDLNSSGNTATTKYTYDGGSDTNPGDVTTITDPNLNTETLAYDAYGNTLTDIQTATQAGDQCATCGTADETSYAYYPDGQVETTTEPDGNANGGAQKAAFTTTDAYFAAGNLDTETGGHNDVTTYGYDGDLNQILSKSPNGNTTYSSYDLDDRTLASSDPASALTVTTASCVSPCAAGATATVDFASTGAYPTAGSMVFVEGISPSGYDGYVDVATSGTTYITYALPAAAGAYSSGGSVSIPSSSQTYDPVGNQATSTDYSTTDNTTVDTYDPLDRLATEKNAGGYTTTDAYWYSGNLKSTTDPRGNEVYDTYTWTDHVSTETSGYGQSNAETETYTYDNDGNVATDESGNSHTTHTYYNYVDWTTSTVDPLGNTTSYNHDYNGNVILESDPGNGNGASNTTHDYYDALNRLQYECVDGAPARTTCQSDPTKNSQAQDQATYTYDNDGNQVSGTDANGNPWTSATYAMYGGQDVPVSQTAPNNETTSYTYDLDGNQRTLRNPSGNTATYSYDASDNMSGISYSDGVTPGVSYSYYPDGDTHVMTDGSGTTTDLYNARGDLSQVTDGNGDVMKYYYDNADNLDQITFPDTNSVTYGYDDMNRMSSMADWLGHTTSFGYDLADNHTSTTYPNGTTGSFGFDAAERLNNATYEKSGVTQMEFDASKGTSTNGLYPNGQIEGVTTTQASGYGLTPGTSQAYSYDPVQRLTGDTQAGTGAVKSTQTFNPNSEIQSATGALNPAGGTAPGYYNYATSPNDAGEMASITTGQNRGGSLIQSYTFDSQGNRTCMSTVNATCSSDPSPTTYTYDQENRLTGWSNPSSGPGTETYAHDGNGLPQTMVFKPNTGGGGCPLVPLGASRARSSRSLNS